jgi:hypothetical protein
MTVTHETSPPTTDSALDEQDLQESRRQQGPLAGFRVIGLFALKLGGGLIPGRHAGAEMR